MYQLLGLLLGIVIAIMVAVNGLLTKYMGLFLSAVIIHVVGTTFAFLILKIRRQKILFSERLPWWLFTGGIIGVLTTVFQNFAFGKISMTNIVALSLFGQTVLSLIIDCTGIWGMKKQPFQKSSIPGLLLALAGILVMMSDSSGFALLSVLLSMGAGLTVVLSRTVNASLAAHTGDLQSSFYNHVVGLPVTILCFLALGRAELSQITLPALSQSFIFFGGTLGVTTVLLCNMTVPRLSAFQLTLLSFVGQVFTGIFIDILTKTSYSMASFWGGVLVAAGILANMLGNRT